MDGGAVARSFSCSTVAAVTAVEAGSRKGHHADGQLHAYREAEVGGEISLKKRISKGRGVEREPSNPG